MAQQQHVADVYPDELCPPNKRYDLMDVNKKVDLEHVQCLPESKILTNIIKNHPLRFSIAASSSVPWIYMAQFWHTLKEDGSNIGSVSIGIYNGVKDTIEFQNNWSSVAMENVMKDILQMLENTCYQIGPTAIADYANDIEHYRIYTEVFGIDVLMTQSQPTESTQGTHRTPSAPKPPNPDKEVAESSAPRHSIMILLRISERRSTPLTPPAPVLNVNKADEMILRDTLQVSLAEHKSHEEQESRENVALVDEHLASEEIDKMVEGHENVIDDSLIPRNDESNIIGTRLDPRSNKESLKVEISKDKEVQQTNEAEVEITKETLVVDVSNNVEPVNVDEEDEEITDEVYELKQKEKGKIIEETRNSPIPTPIRSPRIHTTLISSNTEKLQELMDTHTTPSLTRFMPRKSFDTLSDSLHDVMVETLPTLVDKHIKEQVLKQVSEQVHEQVHDQVLVNTILQNTCQTPAIRPRDQDDPHDDAYPEGENSNQEQDDDFDFWTDSYASDDDEIPSKQVSQDIMKEVSLTINEVKLRKLADEMLRQRCTLGDEHQYHIDQMKNFLQSDIKGNSGPEKIVLSLHKFPVVIFNDDDIEERTSIWIFYIRKHKEPERPKEEVYSNSKITQVVKTYWELGHEHKFITEIVVPYYTDIGLIWSLLVFIRSLVIWERVHDFQHGIESYQQKVNITAPTITFPGIKEYEMFSIV
ncbi:hypothetical protein Tco_1004809 [Tanacetum coccineum]|uniref:Uncharacterized protein n=1 Tax=Tanacetum coccineum TaxID=301880 RepID=A0ABQ5FCX8_9ASTR